MRAVLCKNVPAVRDFRDVICRAAWKNPGSVCEHVAPFPVFPEIFSDFLPFGGGILVEISQPGEGKWSLDSFFSSSGWRRTGRFREILVLRLAKKMVFLAKFLSFGWHKIGYFLGISVFRLAQKWPFSRNSSPLAGIKMVVSGKFLFSCWQKMAILGKFLSFGWHKTGRSWEIFVLRLAKNGDSWKIFVLWMT